MINIEQFLLKFQYIDNKDIYDVTKKFLFF